MNQFNWNYDNAGFDQIYPQPSPNVSDASDFIDYNSSQSKQDPRFLLNQFTAITNLSEQVCPSYTHKLASFPSTSSSQDGHLHQMNSPNVSTDNSDTTKFMSTMDNSDQFALVEETCAEVLLGNQSPVESQFTSNEEKVTGKTESGQSIYKNKYKECLEQAKAFIDDLMKLSPAKYSEVLEELQKTPQEWEKDGCALGKKLRAFEEKEAELEKVKGELESIQADIKREKTIMKDFEKAKKDLKDLQNKSAKNDKEAKKLNKHLEKARIEVDALFFENSELKTRLPEAKQNEGTKKKEQKSLQKAFDAPKTQLLEALKVKRLARFAPIYELLVEITVHSNKNDWSDYFDNYKKKRSMKYFETCAEEEHFYWILLLKVVLLLIPQQKTILKLLPLQKDTLPFMYWLMDSPIMKLKHKNLFRESYVRSHLRNEFTRVCNTLVFSAKKKAESGEWSQAKWNLLERLLNAEEIIPELYMGNTHTPMAQDLIFETEEVNSVAEETSKTKRLFEQMSLNDDYCDDLAEDFHDVEKRFYYGHC